MTIVAEKKGQFFFWGVGFLQLEVSSHNYYYTMSPYTVVLFVGLFKTKQGFIWPSSTTNTELLKSEVPTKESAVSLFSPRTDNTPPPGAI